VCDFSDVYLLASVLVELKLSTKALGGDVAAGTVSSYTCRNKQHSMYLHSLM
jgi:hypothetical protein